MPASATATFELGRELVAQALPVARGAGLVFWEAEEARELASIERAGGRLDLAEMHGRDSLERNYRIRSRTGVIVSLVALAFTARTAADVERAGLLWGAVEAEERRAPSAWPSDRELWEARICADAGSEFERGRRAGSLLSLDEAVQLALGDIDA